VNKEQALKQLEDAEVVPCVSAGIADAKEVLGACLDADIPAILDRQEACGGHGHSCAPRFDLCVRPEDVPKVTALLQARWKALMDQEGTLADHSAGASESDNPPCPACGCTAALVEGACAECGLQLEQG
jgi:hypothetical protein